uniref:Uncharacterized protein n=1 Tax=Anopheles dirus TaxID=7168 RepID=A0A182N8J1_9DIPT
MAPPYVRSLASETACVHRPRDWTKKPGKSPSVAGRQWPALERTGCNCNCAHAVSDIAPIGPRRGGSPRLHRGRARCSPRGVADRRKRRFVSAAARRSDVLGRPCRAQAHCRPLSLPFLSGRPDRHVAAVSLGGIGIPMRPNRPNRPTGRSTKHEARCKGAGPPRDERFAGERSPARQYAATHSSINHTAIGDHRAHERHLWNLPVGGDATDFAVAALRTQLSYLRLTAK